jgi:YbbR domain-containing protein
VVLKAQDAKEQAISNVRIEPSRVLVTLAMRKTTLRKKLLLSADIKGSPAPGYTLSGYTFTPNMIEVDGDAASLESLSAITLPVEINNIQANQTRTLSDIPVEMLPTGVQWINKAPFALTLTVRRLGDKTPNL